MAVVSGTVGVPPLHVESPTVPVSAIIFHGMADPTVPYDSSTKGLIEATSAPESAAWWAKQDGCGKAIESESGGGDIKTLDFKNGPDGPEVELVSRKKGVHAWPTSEDADDPLPATDMIWDFFKAHPRR